MPFKEILIDRAAADTDLAQRLIQGQHDLPVRLVSRPPDEGVGPSSRSKRTLYVTLEKGRFLRPCPGTPGMQCCNLFVLNPVVGCPFDCAYCFLQAYQNSAPITLYANLEGIVEEVAALRAANPGKLLRICTGEVADSLALEPMVEIAAHLVGLFAKMDQVLLELKTKSTQVDHLLSLDHRGKTVLSWSLNPEELAVQIERGAPSPKARLRAARAAAQAGYPLAFHFDPLVRMPNWKNAYQELISALFDSVPAEQIRWISLGGFRYTAAMKTRILERFPNTELFLGEFLPCGDGKYRYFTSHRVALYRELLAAIRGRSENVPVYLCMEADYIWRRVFGRQPESVCGLEGLFTPMADL